jgi:exodeoxyribonuclease VII small subunit
MSSKSTTFEGAMTRLDEIVKILEDGNVPLEKSIKLFEEGTKLAAQCNSLLETAELKVSELMKGPDGAPIEKEISNEQL